jgi:hypothetical protein
MSGRLIFVLTVVMGAMIVGSVFWLAPDRIQLVSAYAKRGGIPANEIAFKQATAPTQQPPARPPAEESPAPANSSPDLRQAKGELRCVQRARGDMTKLLACARS